MIDYRGEQIPDFLRSHADMIMRTGKYLNVIQQCDKSIEWPDNEEIVYLTNSENGLAIRDELVFRAIGGQHPAFSWLRYDPY